MSSDKKNKYPGETNREGFVLGYPLDQLFNRNCSLDLVPQKDRKKGLFLPKNSHPGSGNIIISGPPGSGKSTLAMQLAVIAARRSVNRSITAYLSLENSPDELISKAKPFGWSGCLKRIMHLHQISELSSVDDYSKMLLRVITQPVLDESKGKKSVCQMISRMENKNACKEHNHFLDMVSEDLSLLTPTVLLPSLSPRYLQDDNSDELFWKRYRQLEMLLAAGTQLDENLCNQLISKTDKQPEDKMLYSILRLMVVDSLNMFSSKPISREEMYRLFSLFRKYRAIGIFVVESTEETPFDSTMADIVISLSMAKEKGYFIRYFEIEKSRYINQVLGQHPFKTVSLIKNEGDPLPYTPILPNKNHKDLALHGAVIFPSLHYLVLRTGESKKENIGDTQQEEQNKCRFYNTDDIWKIKAFRNILPNDLMRGSVITISGKRGTFKKNLALTFLLRGLQKGENCLLIRLHDNPQFGENIKSDKNSKNVLEKWPSISIELLEEGQKNKKSFWEYFHSFCGEDNELWQNISNKEKAQFSLWQYDSSHETKGILYEIDFKTGSLLPEEFVHIVREVIIRQKSAALIKRVIFGDISEIGSAYPFLRDSITSGDMFIPAFAHLLRNHGIDLVMFGTKGDLDIANEAVDRACSVSDAVITTRFIDVFGKRYVMIEGVGQKASREESLNNFEISKTTPPVILYQEFFDENTHKTYNAFEVSQKYLEGLVDLESGKAKRPGIVLYLFEDTQTVHNEYNWRILNMVRSKVYNLSDPRSNDIDDSAVSIFRFNSFQSEAVHHSIQVLSTEKPLNRTELYTVDEFFFKSPLNNKLFAEIEIDEKERKKFIFPYCDERYTNIRPYYANVLLLAYRLDFLERNKNENQKINWSYLNPPDSWKKIFKSKKLFNINKKEEVFFWIDRSAPETLSCILMDALLSASITKKEKQAVQLIKRRKHLFKNTRKEGALRQKENRLKSILFPKNPNASINPRQQSEIKALCDLFNEIKLPDSSLEEKGSYSTNMPPNSAIYVCWYSQLRGLLEEYPSLTSKIGVCPLPGGGFTGDWFLGLAKGSVSIDLGMDMIDIFCSKEEEYKRLSMGVGLPIRQSFYEPENNFYAWQGGCSVDLSEIYHIHEWAFSRYYIDNYEKIRDILSSVGNQLLIIKDDYSCDRKQKIIENVNRMLPKIKLLSEGK